MVDLAISDPDRLTLVLRFADVGIATYASLRVIGEPSRTVTWVVEEPLLLAALQELDDALPEPRASEGRHDAIERALARGPFAAPHTELTVAYILGVLLIASPGWQLLTECTTSPRALLFISPSARLARVPWGLLALPKSGPTAEELVRHRADAITTGGRAAARIPWQLADISEHTDGYRLMELADILMAVPQNIVHSPRTPPGWDSQARRPSSADPRPSGAGAAPGRRTRVGARQAVGAIASGTALRRTAATPTGTARTSVRRSSCFGARTPIAGGWRSCWPRTRVGSSMSGTRVRQTAAKITEAGPTVQHFTWPVRR